GDARDGGNVVQRNRRGNGGAFGHGDVAAGAGARTHPDLPVGARGGGGRMTLDAPRGLLQPLVGPGLDLAQKLDIETHVRSCVGCAEYLHNLTELRQVVREKAPYYQAPENLAGRVQAAVRASAKAEAGPRFGWAWPAAISLASAAAILWA